MPATPRLPQAGVPSDLLERQPDIVAAEREVASAFNSLDEAKVAHLPTITLSGSVNASSSKLSDIFNAKQVLWNAAGDLVTPIFDGGLRKGQIDEETADQKSALANYGAVSIAAFEEVETALDDLVSLRKREAHLRRSSKEYKEALRLSLLGYKAGDTDLLDVLSIQQQANDSESDYVSIKKERLDAWVTLNLALGGGWVKE